MDQLSIQLSIQLTNSLTKAKTIMGPILSEDLVVVVLFPQVSVLHSPDVECADELSLDVEHADGSD